MKPFSEGTGDRKEIFVTSGGLGDRSYPVNLEVRPRKCDSLFLKWGMVNWSRLELTADQALLNGKICVTGHKWPIGYLLEGFEYGFVASVASNRGIVRMGEHRSLATLSVY